MVETDLDRLLAEVAEETAIMRGELRAMLPQLRARKLSLETYIKDLEKHPSFLFSLAPPLPGGGHASLLAKEEAECAKAVIVVLKKRLALVYRAMGAEVE